MSWKMDDDVLIYVLNELLESQRMVDIFKVMMEYEDFEMDWLAEQFLSLLERLDESMAYQTVQESSLKLFRNLISERWRLLLET